MGGVGSKIENFGKDVFTGASDVFSGHFDRIGEDAMGAFTGKDVAGLRKKRDIYNAKVNQAKKFAAQSKAAQIRAYQAGQQQQRELQQAYKQKIGDASNGQILYGGRKKCKRANVRVRKSTKRLSKKKSRIVGLS